MPIHAQIDGVGTLEFPDGTSPDVIHAGVLGRVAGTAAKEIAKETLKYGPLYYAARKMWGH